MNFAILGVEYDSYFTKLAAQYEIHRREALINAGLKDSESNKMLSKDEIDRLFLQSSN